MFVHKTPPTADVMVVWTLLYLFAVAGGAGTDRQHKIQLGDKQKNSSTMSFVTSLITSIQLLRTDVVRTIE